MPGAGCLTLQFWAAAQLSPEELGHPAPRDGDVPSKGIEYTDVYEGSDFTVCIFKLPAGARLPMHDHPRMTVLSKVLWGDMAVTAYDRAEQPSEETRGGPDLSPFQVSTKAPTTRRALMPGC